MDAAEGEREGGVEGSCGTITHKILTFHFAAIEVNSVVGAKLVRALKA